MSTPPSPPRRRGAPLGNANALKHGFYSPRHLRATVDDTGVAFPTGLVDEITILRLFMRRIIEMSRSSQDLAEVIDAARVLALISFSISRLVRTQESLATSSRFFKDALNNTLEDALLDLSQEEPTPSP
jgi:hypothetical protein